MTASLHGQSKIIIFPEKGIQRSNILRLSKSKAPSKVKRHLLTSYQVNEVTKRAPRDDSVNVTLMAQGAYRILFCILQLTNNPSITRCFTPTVILDKNTRELGNNENPSKKLKKFTFFYVRT